MLKILDKLMINALPGLCILVNFRCKIIRQNCINLYFSLENECKLHINCKLLWVLVVLKGKCNDFLAYFFIVLLYYIIDTMFTFLILLKMINYLGRYAAPKLHFFASCHFCSGSRVQPENMSLEAEVNSSKWLNKDRTTWISSILTRTRSR